MTVERSGAVLMPINPGRRRFLATAATTIAGLELGMIGSMKSLLAGPLSSLPSATTWLHSPPLTAESLRGKVVLVDFCTYTCINWLRQLPYVRAWAEKYRDRGLVVIGVHTPEFAFEHDLDNVRQALKELRVEYPVAVDNAYAIWSAFDNQYWPALYFLDAKGIIRHRQFGEGGYDEAERMIQKLVGSVERELVKVEGQGIEAAADWDNLRSPENYLGSERTERLVPNSAAAKLRLNQWTVAGNWTVGRRAAELNEPDGRIVARFHARDLHLVLGPSKKGSTVRCRVWIDGQAPGSAHGLDVDVQGNGAVTQQRLYQLVRQSRPIIDRLFEIEFLDSGVQAFAFTFG